MNVETTVTYADCGCGITDRMTLAFCPLHAQAEALREALNDFTDLIVDWLEDGAPHPAKPYQRKWFESEVTKAEAVIAAAKGGAG